MANDRLLPPPTLWAQRKNAIFITFCVEDCKSPEIKVESNSVYFKGTGGTEKKDYEVTIELYSEIDSEKSRYFVRDRVTEMILIKKDQGNFWPHLLKDKIKVHWLKIDFSKWKDEDDSDDESKDQNLEDMIRQMGGLGDGMRGSNDAPSLDDLAGMEDSDESDDELPDLE